MSQNLWTHWNQPSNNNPKFTTGLKLANNLTGGTLVDFYPIQGKQVKFYYCGPTVYSHTHIGHARTYLSIDTIKRIMRDYFGYDMFTVMNITDIDDKIIKTSNEQNIPFQQFTRIWEKNFFTALEALNIELPDAITRVSDFVPEIIEFIKKIIDNGYAYQANGSVYFDVQKYRQDGYFYCKLEPFSAADLEKLQEGEGASQEGKESEKKNAFDFALWKNSKPNEPKWNSPWGEGRPGWHIECSVMAYNLLGNPIDLHAGGIDLRFPHHDNSIAQTEACLKEKQWINYFIHTGHLNISGKKMSKSLKNFLTIEEVLKRYSGRQVRLNFSLHRYDVVMNYSEDQMLEAIAKDKYYGEFFLNLQATIRNIKVEQSDQKWLESETKLNNFLLEKKQRIHSHFCNNFDFPSVLKDLDDLIKNTNIYLQGKDPRKPLLTSILNYCGYIFGLFGLDYTQSAGQSDDLFIGAMDTFVNFRDQIRLAAKEKNFSKIFEICDQVRDDDLPLLGIKLEDKGFNEKSIWKQSNKEDLLREREQKLKLKQKLEEEKQKKEQEKKEKEEKRLNQMKIKPEELFINMKDQYSEFDEKGIPTKDAKGENLSKKQQKNVQKQWEDQKKLHEQYLGQQLEQQEEKKE